MERVEYEYSHSLLFNSQKGSSAEIQLKSSHKRRVITIICGLMSLTFCFYGYWSFNENSVQNMKDYYYEELISQSEEKDYLINTEACIIPYIDPFTSDVKPLIKKIASFRCSKFPPLIVQTLDEEGRAVLKVKEELIEKYTYKKKRHKLECCLHYIDRSKERNKEDEKVTRSTCIKFSYNVTVPENYEWLTVDCKANKRPIYSDTFAIVRQKAAVVNRSVSLAFKRNPKPWNILIFGIDSLSRNNLYRTMPMTAKFLQQEEWFDFRAFQKVGDNTYPNLMPILTGMSKDKASAVCEPKSAERFTDKCNFIWKDFQDLGYATAYAEDFIPWDTFGRPNHKGFEKSPTDHYIKPLFLANERAVTTGNKLLIRCSGSKSSGEHIMQFGLDFMDRYRENNFFGFLWSNSYSHEDFNSPRVMDEKVARFLDELKQSGVMENTFVVFMGDHGMRFGDIRTSLSGYYEVRLPALFISVPKEFRMINPSFVDAIELNTRRLVTPYDLYLTMREILSLSSITPINLNGTDSCRSCQSLFKEVPSDRDCESLNIDPYWCTCKKFDQLPKTDVIVIRSLQYFTDVYVENTFKEINKDCHKCAIRTLSKIISAHAYYGYNVTRGFIYLRNIFKLNPGETTFEAFIKYYPKENKFTVENVDRFAYFSNAECVTPFWLKKICYCNTKHNHKSAYGKLC